MYHFFKPVIIALCLACVCTPALAQDPFAATEDQANALYRIAHPTSLQWRYATQDIPNAHEPAFDDSSWKSANASSFQWGTEEIAWLRTKITVPDDPEGIPIAGGRITFKCAVDDDGVIYVDGREVQKFHWDEGSTVLTESAQPGQTFHIAIKGINTGGPGRLLNSEIEYVATAGVTTSIDALLEKYHLAKEVYFASDPTAREPYLPVIEQAMSAVEVQALKAGKKDEFLASVGSAATQLESVFKLADQLTCHLVGHAHIDMNWLWLWPETVEVCKNTFSTAAKLMDEYPDFIFSQSQPAVYLAMQENEPAVFATIQDRIKRGQWDAIGTTWTEGDTNMSSGESIVRSILYGKRYMKQQFGVDSTVCWEPDTFGHVWTLPQILAKSGIKYYYFARCNKGYPLFWWEGPDGSRVLAYSYGGYSSDISENDLLHSAVAFAKTTGIRDYMRVYGVGDHGGGPTREMLDVASDLRTRDNYPKIKFSKVSDYFETVLKTGHEFPVFKGELNTVFEGCYTTHSDIKRWNRKSENLLSCAEKFSAIAANWRVTYSTRGFEDSWRNTCFNQFHDLLCGSAIHGSYDYSKKLYDEATSQAEFALDNSLDALVERITTKGTGIPIVVFNSLSWTRTDPVNVPSPFSGQEGHFAVTDESGTDYPALNIGDRLSFTARDVPAMGYKVFWAHRAPNPVPGGIKCVQTTIENQFFRVRVDPDLGVIQSIYDKVNARHAMPPDGASALLQILLEKPHGMSAWTIGETVGHEDLVGNTDVTLVDCGPTEATVMFDHQYGKSQFTQEVTLYDAVPRIDLRVTADWQELGTADTPAPMLKAAFPTNLKNAKATFEIPYGSIERPANGAEVPALKWIDLSESDYGVSLLNDSKYGFDVNGAVMRATLLRSSYEPDPTPDQGIHEMTLSLYPHKGDWREALTVRRGFELNQPLIVRVTTAHAGSLPSSQSFVSISAPNVVVTALKQAEDDRSLILRFYEAHGKSCRTTVKLNLPFEYFVETDLLENPLGEKQPIAGKNFTVDVGKHEIKTYKLLRR